MENRFSYSEIMLNGSVGEKYYCPYNQEIYLYYCLPNYKRSLVNIRTGVDIGSSLLSAELMTDEKIFYPIKN